MQTPKHWRNHYDTRKSNFSSTAMRKMQRRGDVDAAALMEISRLIERLRLLEETLKPALAKRLERDSDLPAS